MGASTDAEGCFITRCTVEDLDRLGKLRNESMHIDDLDAWVGAVQFLRKNTDIELHNSFEITTEYLLRHPMLKMILDRPGTTRVSFTPIKKETYPWRIEIEKEIEMFVERVSQLKSIPDQAWGYFDELRRITYHHGPAGMIVADPYLFNWKYSNFARGLRGVLDMHLPDNINDNWPMLFITKPDESSNYYRQSNLFVREMKRMIYSIRPKLNIDVQVALTPHMHEFHDRVLIAHYGGWQSGHSFPQLRITKAELVASISEQNDKVLPISWKRTIMSPYSTLDTSKRRMLWFRLWDLSQLIQSDQSYCTSPAPLSHPLLSIVDSASL